ncbi:branched-chain amino acid ABC transporter permease [Mesorhizobium australicum]|uniref:Amino acid/amide ABC transporter membrane protein 2, HAAT family n=1 Tax=Mesorhizobium australicum TaxID=536018 RepID=A0A1X7MTQ7_9HYPH|nr:branched-chain amino acid ABC transporter permease [Mesorhizobium australicum]SMH27718.1 amino acid/amide ABC transporter membrane protein 2, HAAT family [Mesorhizobium australicum]
MNRIVVVVLCILAVAPFFFQSQFVANMALLTALGVATSQAWNIAGGYSGLTSFGHVAFFGTGAYTVAILQTRYGINPWVGIPLGALIGALTGYVVGWCTCRAGLRGSYFALVTLAFAEALRIIANSVDFTRGGLGIPIPLQMELSNFQFSDKRIYYGIALIVVAIATSVSIWIERSRFGAQLIATRENTDAARALGINIVQVRASALAISGAITALTGVIYTQVFLYIDPTIAFGVGRSVEMMLMALVGGAGTVLGPIVGGVMLHLLGEVIKDLTNIPGIAPASYGVVLLLIIAFMPRGIVRKRRA